jgi:hypothetical protein
MPTLQLNCRPAEHGVIGYKQVLLYATHAEMPLWVRTLLVSEARFPHLAHHPRPALAHPPSTLSPQPPEVLKRQRDHATRAEERKQRKAALAAARDALAADGFSRPFAGPTASGPSKAADAAAQARDAPTGAARGAPRGKNAFLFPGQGSQAVGMIREAAAQLPAVREMLEVAKTVLGYDMLELIQKGRLIVLILFDFTKVEKEDDMLIPRKDIAC